MTFEINQFPEVSVLISCYNHEKWIMRCLRSLNNQLNIPHDNFEIILVDDGSNDNFKSLVPKINKLKNLKLITNKKNIGLPASLNKAIQNSTGRYLVRVDSDDYVERNFLFFLKYFLNKNPHFHAVSSDYYEVSDNEQIIKRCFSKRKEIACGVMYRRECLYDVGLFNTDFKMREGHELHKKFKKKFNIAYIQLPLYKYRMHSNNRTKDKKSLKKYDQKLNKK